MAGSYRRGQRQEAFFLLDILEFTVEGLVSRKLHLKSNRHVYCGYAMGDEWSEPEIGYFLPYLRLVDANRLSNDRVRSIVRGQMPQRMAALSKSGLTPSLMDTPTPTSTSASQPNRCAGIAPTSIRIPTRPMENLPASHASQSGPSPGHAGHPLQGSNLGIQIDAQERQRRDSERKARQDLKWRPQGEVTDQADEYQEQSARYGSPVSHRVVPFPDRCRYQSSAKAMRFRSADGMEGLSTASTSSSPLLVHLENQSSSRFDDIAAELRAHFQQTVAGRASRDGGHVLKSLQAIKSSYSPTRTTTHATHTSAPTFQDKTRSVQTVPQSSEFQESAISMARKGVPRRQTLHRPATEPANASTVQMPFSSTADCANAEALPPSHPRAAMHTEAGGHLQPAHVQWGDVRSDIARYPAQLNGMDNTISLPDLTGLTEAIASPPFAIHCRKRSRADAEKTAERQSESMLAQLQRTYNDLIGDLDGAQREIDSDSGIGSDTIKMNTQDNDTQKYNATLHRIRAQVHSIQSDLQMLGDSRERKHRQSQRDDLRDFKIFQNEQVALSRKMENLRRMICLIDEGVRQKRHELAENISNDMTPPVRAAAPQDRHQAGFNAGSARRCEQLEQAGSISPTKRCDIQIGLIDEGIEVECQRADKILAHCSHICKECRAFVRKQTHVTEVPATSGNGSTASERPSQVVTLSRKIARLEQELSNLRQTYAEMSREYIEMDGLTHKTRRRWLGEHLRLTIGFLEAKADEITACIDQLHISGAHTRS